MVSAGSLQIMDLLAAVIFGIRLVGVNQENAKKLLFTLIFIAAVLLLSKALAWLTSMICKWFESDRVAFWSRQGVRVLTSVILVIGLLSIWFEDPARLATVLGLVSAGMAFALQRVITALAGYLVILRGRTFNIGDRIVMGGVRGDVVGLGFIQTTIMEMGQPPGEQGDDPSMWVKSRQYTGRIVTVSNDKIFDTPVYNYTRDFQYIWEELTLPIAYRDDRGRIEQILLAAARTHSVAIPDVSEADLHEMERRFRVPRAELVPRVYWRMTDNWVELTVRFVANAHGARELKDAMSRQILAAMDEAKIGVASATIELAALPTVRLHIERDRGSNHSVAG